MQSPKPEEPSTKSKAQRPKPEALAAKRIAHLSDVHFGKLSHPGIVKALVEEVNAAGMDLVVVSGDLTQRAKDDQYRDAKAMLDAFEAPVLVVPGNHDVRQFWHNPIERVITPTIRFERCITDDLMPTFSMDGLSVFGMNTAYGLTVKGGLVRQEALDAMQSYFDVRPEGDLRILVAHHHFFKNPALGRTDVALGAAKTIKVAIALGVDLLLCGHYHISNVTAHDVGNGRKIVVASAGTATSSRGRGEHKAINMYNWITGATESFAVEERRFHVGEVLFASVRTSEFVRTGE